MNQAKSLPTPMTSNLYLLRYKGEPVINGREYRSIVEELKYATITRPKSAYSANKVSQFVHQPLDGHWIAVKRILRSLNGTLDNGLILKQSRRLRITRLVNAEWASTPDSRRQTTGYCTFLGKNPVSWYSNKRL